MSIIISDLAYRHSDRTLLFERVSLSVGDGCKASVIGNNGTGKSTLLHIIAGESEPFSGSVSCSSIPYYIPQNIGISEQTVAEALGIADKLQAIEEITKGAVNPELFEVLNDDWEVENRSLQALETWGLGHIDLHSLMNKLSGGERTKLYLAGIAIHEPQVILLDEPTNHLDYTGRERLYDLVRRSKATMLIVSHDITLLNLLDHTYELSSHGTRLYGGNYDFYREQKDAEVGALSESIEAEEKALRLARKKAQEARERQQRRESAGAREVGRGGQPRIIANAKANKGEATGAKLQDTHARKIEQSRERLTELRSKRESTASLRIDFDDAELHKGKLLFAAEGINHEYIQELPLWSEPLDFALYSGDRIHLTGDNGSGKTTLIKILTGDIQPTHGSIRRADFSYIYLDQDCSVMNSTMTVYEMAESFNSHHLEEHEIKIRLNRALFPKEAWDKSCSVLSGGERMKLYLCCLMIGNYMPDLFILDEPTNNLDISSLTILIDTIHNYNGSVLVISHDRYFVSEIGINREYNICLRIII